MAIHPVARSVLVAGLILAVPAVTGAQAPEPRTPWGDPDLQGIWDFRTITPLERPGALAGKRGQVRLAVYLAGGGAGAR